MRYQLKSIFRNRMTWTLLAIIIILNLYTVISIEQKVYPSRDEVVVNLEMGVLIMKSTLDSEKGFVKSQNSSPEYLKIFENYVRYREWLIRNDERESEIYRSSNIDQYSEELSTVRITELLAVMDLFADPGEGRPLSEEVFEEDLKNIKVEKELPFDSTQLRIYNHGLEAEKDTVYNGSKISITRLLNLFKNNEKRLELDIASPWTFYVMKVGFEEFSVPILCTLCFIYASAMAIEDRKSRSMQLVKVLPKNKGYILGHYYTAILAAVLTILIISFLIPILLTGIRHGFGGLKNPILVDPKGFVSFNGYEHVDIWGTLGLGRFATSSTYMEFGPNPSNQLEFYPLWKVMGLSMIPTILKLLFLTLLGVGIGLCISNKMVSILVTSLAAVIYILSQLYGADMLLNPLSIGSSWNITLGGTPFTWFRAVVVLIAGLMAGTTVILAIIRKQDFNV